MFAYDTEDYHVSVADLDTMDSVPEEMQEAPEDEELDASLVSKDPIEDTEELISYTDRMVHTGWWGFWRYYKMRPNPFYFACGARMRWQGAVGGGDDTAMNGLQMKYCHKANWHA